MVTTASTNGRLLTVHACSKDAKTGSGMRSFIVHMPDDKSSERFAAALPSLRRRFDEEADNLREQRLNEAIRFFAREMIAGPSVSEMRMTARLGQRYARILDEFGFYTAAQLAQLAGSRARNRTAMADNWRRRGQVFSVPHPDEAAGFGDVYPGFQFDASHKPLPVIRRVLQAFNGGRLAWKLALWFTSNNGMLPDGARPVDLIQQDADEAIVRAAEYDAMPSAA